VPYAYFVRCTLCHMDTESYKTVPEAIERWLDKIGKENE
jgi:hypothetical protein